MDVIDGVTPGRKTPAEMEAGMGLGSDIDEEQGELKGSASGGRTGNLRSLGTSDRNVTHASYGKACMNCVRSKTRCGISIDGSRCERCQRLNKNCQPTPTVRKKRAPRISTTSASRTAALEERLDGIVQMLQRSQAPQEQTHAALHSMSTFTPPNGQPLDTAHDDNYDPKAIRTQIEMFDAGTVKVDLHDIYNRGLNMDAQGSMGSGDFFARPVNKTCSAPLPGQGDSPGLSYQQLNGKIHFGGHEHRLDTLLKAAEEGARCSSTHTTPITLATSSNSHTSNTPGLCSESSASTNRSATTSSFPACKDYPLEDEAELQECLDSYRTKMVPYFPIVCLPPSASVHQLCSERPFLWLVIRAICSNNTARRSALGLEVRKKLACEMLLEGTKSLDLFLGLLAYIAWNHFYVCRTPIVSTLVHLAMSLAFDLGLTKQSTSELQTFFGNCNAQGTQKMRQTRTDGRTMEEKRALVGLFLVSSVTSTYFQRTEPLRWTPYLDECLQVLEETQEYATDQLLVYSVRLQSICNQISCVPWGDTAGPTGTTAPHDLFVKMLESQLEDIKRSLPPDLRTNDIIQLYIFNTTLSIHEHSLSTTIVSPTSSVSGSAIQLKRIASLWSCFEATKSWFALFFSLSSSPVSGYQHISMAVLTQMAHLLIILFRLSTFEHPEVPWDRLRVRQELDLGETLGMIAERWKTVAASIDATEDGLEQDYWYFTSKRLTGIKNWWESKVVAMKAAEEEKEGFQNVSDSELGMQGQIGMMDFAAMNADLWDGPWTRDVLTGTYEFPMEEWPIT